MMVEGLMIWSILAQLLWLGLDVRVFSDDQTDNKRSK